MVIDTPSLVTVMDRVNTVCAAIMTAGHIASALIHCLLMLQGQEMTMDLRNCDYSSVITEAAVVMLSHLQATIICEYNH